MSKKVKGENKSNNAINKGNGTQNRTNGVECENGGSKTWLADMITHLTRQSEYV